MTNKEEALSSPRDETGEQIRQLWILWIDYGPEGWRPQGYASPSEAIFDAMNNPRGERMLLTKRATFKAEG